MDWKNIILEVLATGYTQVQIATEVGVKQPTIAGLLSGDQRDMKWVNGHRLLSLHRRVTRRRRPTKEAEHA